MIILEDVQNCVGDLAHEFTDEISLHISSEMARLQDYGIPAVAPTSTWEEYLGMDMAVIGGHVRNAIILYVRIYWDPPQNSHALDSLKEALESAEMFIASHY